MQFKHPELLYALALLLIPIIIHLFQLRKFQKIAFTNVAFLKKVQIQTRKSSQLKKWLTLLIRLLALACIILAFAQPFIASKTALNTNKETVVYLDNSFSMQARGTSGPLLQRAKQQLYDEAKGNGTLSWLTNTTQQKNGNLQNFKSAILDVPYVAKQLTPEEVLLKANQLFSKYEASDKRLLWISDFQSNGILPDVSNGISVEAVQLRPQSFDNVSIDTAYIASKNATITKLNVQVTALGNVATSVPLSLLNGNELIAKTAVDFTERREATITFDLDASETFEGKLTINDANLAYDNSLYFSINAPKKIKVLAVSENNVGFLQRIFENQDFEFTAQTANQPDYNIFASQNFIILNELQSIPNSLTTALKDFVNKGGSILIIPSEKGRMDEYNLLLNTLRIGSYGDLISQEKKITKIAFSHPLYKDVFERKVANFQYPKVNSYFTLSTNAGAALSFDDNAPFIVQNEGVYASTAAFNNENSNFKSSPLIVPTLLNMAFQSLSITQLYYHTGTQNTYAVPVNLLQDEIVSLRDSLTTFVPMQQAKANKVDITTLDNPLNAGIYAIEKKGEFIENVSYNFSRSESKLSYLEAENWQDVRTYDSIEALFDSLVEENSINSFWKWFVIFGLLFLLLEMLVLKFYKK